MVANSTNMFKSGETIFSEGEKGEYIYLVLKGKVEISNGGFAIVMGAGTLLGYAQVSEPARFTCKAREDAAVYVLQAGNGNAMLNFMVSKKEYNGIAVFNHSRLNAELWKQQKRLTGLASSMYQLAKKVYPAYLEQARKCGARTCLMPELVQLEEYISETETDEKALLLSLEYCKIPYDAMKPFFGCSAALTAHTLMKLVDTENSLTDACTETAEYVAKVFDLMIGNPAQSLYRSLMGLIVDLKKQNLPTEEAQKMADELLGLLPTVKDALGQHSGRGFKVNEAELTGIKEAVLRGEDFRGEEEETEGTLDSDIAARIAALNDSYHQLTAFGKYEEDKTEEFAGYLDTFEKLPDRESSDDEFRKLRKSLADHFYALYIKVFMESLKATRVPEVVDLFLNYGFVSEKLLTEGQISELLSLSKEKCNAPCEVYTMREWLTAIYNGEKEPSRNDMGQDYAEVLREKKKTGEIDAEGEKEYLVSGEKKAEYEIKEVLAHGNRVVNGQLSIFVPVLHAEMFIGGIDKAFCSPEKLNTTVLDIEKIDFSVFYRESLYVNKEAGIEKEMQMKKVYPVFIMYPTVGLNSIMWQEITGRKRDTEGRFLVPSFAYSELSDMLIKAFGQFRWALCKTIQGTAWNNIQIKSLTSEYSDYIQFYKKNHDLSEERKEKLKLQIQRGRNNLREVFALDYIGWVKSESSGSMRLNKVAREMLATYCPFSAQIREALVKQPMYAEAYARYIRECNKKVHELELRYRALEAKKVVVPEELINTLAFYRDL